LTEKRQAVLKKMKLLFFFTRLPRFAHNDIKTGLASRPAPRREADKYSRIIEKTSLIFYFSLFSVQGKNLYLRRI